LPPAFTLLTVGAADDSTRWRCAAVTGAVPTITPGAHP